MFASFLITFREGLEAFLIVGIILSYLTKVDAKDYNKFIYLGVFFGIGISLFIAYIFQVLIYSMDSQLYQHYLMILILLFATIVLSYMVAWMAHQSNIVRNKIEKNLKEFVTTKNVLGMFFLAFLAVLREGFETVLFFSSLTLTEEFSIKQGFIGAIIGLLMSIILIYTLMKGVKNVPLKSFFKYTSLLILIIAGGLFSSAVSIMQASNILPTFIPIVYDISFILDDRGLVGTFLRALFGYNSSPSLLHLLSWFLYMSMAIFLWRKTYVYKKV